ncbi:outer membrane beta-barrel protein [Chitinophaga tropicalis]|uniref:Outer membrane beta-barrel protein n=1 Tax=Chitinophaga tropicalis TaxID=2683588 RepID=A0A7K1U3Z2_9BACT|nr:outer membrane beta-barrel protein [Chitinophaga tropicalis]MVT08715.1 outer membrane beta-barrel protein [Chitinophaga tropicalis]
MIRHFAFTVIAFILGVSLPSRAQTKKKNWQYYFNGGVGYYFPLTAQTSLSESGSVSSFQFQVDYKERLFGRLFFDQYSIAFHTKYMQNGVNTSIEGKVPTTAIGLDLGYIWRLHRFSAYVYAGTGLAVTDIPFLRSGPDADEAYLKSSSRGAMAWRGGLGVNFKINRYFILYLEPQYMSFPVKTQVYNGNLDGVSLQLGFKTPLQ